MRLAPCKLNTMHEHFDDYTSLHVRSPPHNQVEMSQYAPGNVSTVSVECNPAYLTFDSDSVSKPPLTESFPSNNPAYEYEPSSTVKSLEDDHDYDYIPATSNDDQHRSRRLANVPTYANLCAKRTSPSGVPQIPLPPIPNSVPYETPTFNDKKVND